MRILGLFLQIGYHFRRHFMLAIRMDLLVLIVMLLGALIAIRGDRNAVGLGLLALGLAWLMLMIFSHRASYLIFRPEPHVQLEPPASPLKPDATVKLKASGPFAIRDRVATLVNHPAQYTTPRSREHILMAEITPSRLLLVGGTRDHEWGWWYQFIKPQTIAEIKAGQIIHGWRPRLALSVRFRRDKQDKGQETVTTLLSFDDEKTRNLVWENLSREKHTPAPTP